MRESHAIIALVLVESRQVLSLFDTQRGVKEIWGVKHLPQLLLPSCLEVEGKKYLLLPLLLHLPLYPNRAKKSLLAMCVTLDIKKFELENFKNG